MKFLPFALLMFLLQPLYAHAGSPVSGPNTIDGLNRKAQQFVGVNTDSAGRYARKALLLSEKYHYARGRGRALSCLAVAYDIQGKSDSALYFFHQALRLQEKLRDHEGLSYTYNNLGILYYSQYNYPAALLYYRKSLQTDRILNNRAGEAGTLVNMGIVYSYTDSVQQAKKVYAQALDLYTGLNDTMGLSHVYANMGKLCMMEKDHRGALAHFTWVRAFLGNGRHEEARCSNFISLANVYSGMGEHRQALQMCDSALVSARRQNSAERRQFVYDTYTDVYAAKGDYANAYRYLRLYTGLRDSILNENRNTSMAEMSARFEAEKKDARILLLLNEKEKEKMRRREASLRAEKRTAQVQIVVVLLAAVVLLSVVILKAYANKQKLVKTLEEKNTQIGNHLRQKEMLVGEVHHRVKNNLQLISSILELQAKSINDERVAGAILESRNRVYSMSVLHQLLYQQDEITGIALKPYFEKIVMGLLQTNPAVRPVNLRLEVQPLTLDIDTGIPLGLILNELVTNALKYAFAEVEQPGLLVQVTVQDRQLLMTVSDNGPGTAATESKTGSFGFRLIRSLCRQLRAEWSTETAGGYHHRFTIQNFRLI